MEEIKSYLDKMFTGLPTTDKVRKAKSELLTMMTDKYRELIAEGKSENEALGTVIMEFGNLNELSDELGLTEEIRSAEAQTVIITRADAEVYRRANNKYGLLLAIGAAFFILSPIQLIVNGFLGSWNVAPILQSFIFTAGFSALLIFIAAGIGLIIYNETQKPKLRDLKKSLFRLDADADAYIREHQAAEERRNTLLTVVAIACFIFAAIPPIAGRLFARTGAHFIDDAIGIFSVIAVLMIVAFGVGLIIYASVCSRYFKVMLHERASRNPTRTDRRVNAIASSIWALAFPVYLIVSFTTHAWGITWIIFPLVAAINSIIRISTGVKDPDDI